MGAEIFRVTAQGLSATAAFATARQEALHEYGHGGYTGSIAEKQLFRMVDIPAGFDAWQYAEDWAAWPDSAFWQDKWGPAACAQVGPQEFIFWGWASS